MEIELPTDYDLLKPYQRRLVRNLYVDKQGGNCYWCKMPLNEIPSYEILSKTINWDLFPKGFLKYPVHLQHNHSTGMTEGAVHAYCNAVMWQYHGR